MLGHAGPSVATGPGRLVRYVVPAYVVVATVVVGAAIGWAVAGGAAPGHDGTCVFHVGAALSGDAGFFLTEVAPGCAGLTAAEARAAVWWDLGVIGLYALVGTVALVWLWPRAWRISRVRKGLAWVAWLPAATGVADVVENLFVLRGVSDAEGRLSLEDFDAAAAGVAGWWKWGLAAGSIGALCAAAAAALANVRTPQPPQPAQGTALVPPVGNDTGICLSGGGIRSASFATGALRALDRRAIFRRARWIAAVSGGAYAAGAWFIARGRAAEAGRVEPPPEGGRDRLLEPPSEPDLFAYVRKNRRYLATGRGGTPANVVTGLVLIALNLAVLGVLVCVVAWPAGRFASSWVVQPDLRTFDYRGVDLQSLWVDARLWRPGAVGLALALVSASASLFLWERGRSLALRAAGALAGGGVVLLAALVGVPLALAEVPKLLVDLPFSGVTGGAWFAGAVTAAGIAAVALLAFLRPFARSVLRLGGLLVGLLALLLGGKVATDAAYGVGAFAWPAGAYAAVAGAAVLFYALANAQTWSLFRIQYLRLRSTFATTQDEAKRALGAPAYRGVYPLSLEAEGDWHDYAGRPGPKLLVCAAAQNRDDVTGVRALAFTFSDDAVGISEPRWDSSGTRVVTADHLVASDAYVARLRKPWRWAPRLGSVSAAVAVSGAAFTSAMGRQSPGTTNALLAALNVRLGVWMPNPRYPQSGRWKRPRLTYLLKEVFGVHDTDDPYVYVTDGGHRENLGLVELVRRRCRWIYCVDASGDAPESLETLEAARVLARIECGAEIDIDVTPLIAPERGLPDRAVAVGLVRYHTCGGVGPDECETGLLFYGNAMPAKDAPINALSFSLRDRIYPRYPTHDRFLAVDEFDNLVRLGEWIGRSLGLEYERLMRALAKESAEEVCDAPALVEMYERLRGTYDPRRHPRNCRKCV
ncbi:MAG: hypothetical protein ABR613_08655 [Actinomycetota bacterium]